jgi:hypothetical protein
MHLLCSHREERGPKLAVEELLERLRVLLAGVGVTGTYRRGAGNSLALKADLLRGVELGLGIYA